MFRMSLCRRWFYSALVGLVTGPLVLASFGGRMGGGAVQVLLTADGRGAGRPSGDGETRELKVELPGGDDGSGESHREAREVEKEASPSAEAGAETPRTTAPVAVGAKAKPVLVTEMKGGPGRPTEGGRVGPDDGTDAEAKADGDGTDRVDGAVVMPQLEVDWGESEQAASAVKALQAVYRTPFVLLPVGRKSHVIVGGEDEKPRRIESDGELRAVYMRLSNFALNLPEVSEFHSVEERLAVAGVIGERYKLAILTTPRLRSVILRSVRAAAGAHDLPVGRLDLARIRFAMQENGGIRVDVLRLVLPDGRSIQIGEGRS